jgi:segregation and condensation protein B
VDSLLKRFRQRAKAARAIKPLTPLIEEMARELRLIVQEDGLTVAPDSAGIKADILVPLHQSYDMDILERIVQRYEKILGGKS